MTEQEKKAPKMSAADTRDLLIRFVQSMHTINNSVYFNDQKFRAMVMREVRGMVSRLEAKHPDIAKPLPQNYK